LKTFELVRSEDGQTIGTVFDQPAFTMFFANRNCDEAALSKKFSPLEFYRIKQTHSDKMVEASRTLHEADAQWSSQANVGLVISTADCLPILISHPQFVCAIHAGWRGVKNEIIRKSLGLLKEKFSTPLSDAVVAIGPHIHAENFEVDRELGREFLALYDSYFLSGSSEKLAEDVRAGVVLPHERPETKVYLNLTAVAQAQLLLCGVTIANIHDVRMNTYGSNDFASFRRDKTPGRNYSFVARRKSKV
jgi:polyphenol oxidase